MKIIMVHNYYQQPGGEDCVFADESALLESQGHSVERFTVHNESINSRHAVGVLRDTMWNRRVAAAVGNAVRRSGAQIAHFHNTFPLISPAAYYGARGAGAAVVQTLHNYRLLCPNGLFLRNGKICEKCLGRRFPWPAAIYGCYRDNRLQSAAVTAMLAMHRTIGTWAKAVDAFICLSKFSRSKFIEGGLPAEKLCVKTNFVHPDPGMAPRADVTVRRLGARTAFSAECAGDSPISAVLTTDRLGNSPFVPRTLGQSPVNGCRADNYSAFVGRLGPEKGLHMLVDAWSRLNCDVELRIVGSGPLDGFLCQAAQADRRIVLLGRQPPETVYQVVGGAACLVAPSICYENQPRVVIESLAKGTPVVAPRLGAMTELIEDGRTGLLFESQSAADLARTVRKLLSAASADRELMRRAARSAYEEHYTAGTNYDLLMSVYRHALSRRWATRPNVATGVPV